MYQRFKQAYLTNTDLSTGAYTAVFCAIVIVILGAFIGAIIAIWLHSKIAFAVCLAAAAGIAPYAGLQIYNRGLFSIAPLTRAILQWFGARQAGAEVGEGVGWALPYFINKPTLIYEMTQKLEPITAIEVILKSITFSMDVTVEWEPCPGRLYYLGLIPDIKLALKEELKGFARTFVGDQADLDGLVDSSIQTEFFREAFKQYLIKRSDGVLCQVVVHKPAGHNHVTKVELVPKGDAKPWGVTIINVPLTAFHLPVDFTAAATRIAVAKKDAEAGAIKDAAMRPIADHWIERHVDSTASMSQAYDLVDQHTANNITTSNWSSGAVSIVADAILTALGKQPAVPSAAAVAADANAKRKEGTAP